MSTPENRIPPPHAEVMRRRLQMLERAGLSPTRRPLSGPLYRRGFEPAAPVDADQMPTQPPSRRPLPPPPASVGPSRAPSEAVPVHRELERIADDIQGKSDAVYNNLPLSARTGVAIARGRMLEAGAFFLPTVADRFLARELREHNPFATSALERMSERPVHLGEALGFAAGSMYGASRVIGAQNRMLRVPQSATRREWVARNAVEGIPIDLAGALTYDDPLQVPLGVTGGAFFGGYFYRPPEGPRPPSPRRPPAPADMPVRERWDSYRPSEELALTESDQHLRPGDEDQPISLFQAHGRLLDAGYEPEDAAKLISELEGADQEELRARVSELERVSPAEIERRMNTRMAEAADQREAGHVESFDHAFRRFQERAAENEQTAVRPGALGRLREFSARVLDDVIRYLRDESGALGPRDLVLLRSDVVERLRTLRPNDPRRADYEAALADLEAQISAHPELRDSGAREPGAERDPDGGLVAMPDGYELQRFPTINGGWTYRVLDPDGRPASGWHNSAFEAQREASAQWPEQTPPRSESYGAHAGRERFLTRKNQQKAVQGWEEGRAAGQRGSAIWTDGEVIYSYNTPLVWRDRVGRVVFNNAQYSRTTSGHQKALQQYLEYDLVTDDLPINSAPEEARHHGDENAMQAWRLSRWRYRTAADKARRLHDDLTSPGYAVGPGVSEEEITSALYEVREAILDLHNRAPSLDLPAWVDLDRFLSYFADTITRDDLIRWLDEGATWIADVMNLFDNGQGTRLLTGVDPADAARAVGSPLGGAVAGGAFGAAVDREDPARGFAVGAAAGAGLGGALRHRFRHARGESGRLGDQGELFDDIARMEEEALSRDDYRAPRWYSRLRKVIERIPNRSMTTTDLRSYLVGERTEKVRAEGGQRRRERRLFAKQDFKVEELEKSGLLEFLDRAEEAWERGFDLRGVPWVAESAPDFRPWRVWSEPFRTEELTIEGARIVPEKYRFRGMAKVSKDQVLRWLDNYRADAGVGAGGFRMNEVVFGDTFNEDLALALEQVENRANALRANLRLVGIDENDARNVVERLRTDATNIRPLEDVIRPHRADRGDGYNPFGYRVIGEDEARALMDEAWHLVLARLAAEDARASGRSSTDARWSAYTEEGAEPDSYREVVFAYTGDKTYTHPFTTSHWGGVENPVAHERWDVRTDGDERVLFIEEIQSDAHNRRRPDQYAQAPLTELPDGYRVLRETPDQSGNYPWRRTGGDGHAVGRALWSVRGPEGQVVASGETADEARENGIKELNDRRRLGKIPNLPYKGMDEYQGLAVRRAIAEAVEQDLDRVAFASGTLQNQRWGEGSRVMGMRVQYDPSDSTFFLEADIERGAGNNVQPDSVVIGWFNPGDFEQEEDLTEEIFETMKRQFDARNLDEYETRALRAEAEHAAQAMMAGREATQALLQIRAEDALEEFRNELRSGLGPGDILDKRGPGSGADPDLIEMWADGMDEEELTELYVDWYGGTPLDIARGTIDSGDLISEVGDAMNEYLEWGHGAAQGGWTTWDTPEIDPGHVYEYDVVLPGVVEREIKRLDPDAEIEWRDSLVDPHGELGMELSFRITPRMREQVRKHGQHLFSAAPLVGAGLGAASLAEELDEKRRQ